MIDTELTIKDFILHCLNNEYIKKTDVLAKTIQHVEKLQSEYILSSINSAVAKIAGFGIRS